MSSSTLNKPVSAAAITAKLIQRFVNSPSEERTASEGDGVLRPAAKHTERPEVWRENEKSESRLLQVLREKVDQGVIPEAQALRTNKAWQRVKGHIPGVLSSPNIAFSDDGKIMLFWESRLHHLEIETLPDEPQAELFYRNRETGQYQGYDWDVESGAPLRDGFCDLFLPFRVVR